LNALLFSNFDNFLAQVFLEKNIDLAGWAGIGFIVVGLAIIAQFSNIDI